MAAHDRLDAAGVGAQSVDHLATVTEAWSWCQQSSPETMARVAVPASAPESARAWVADGRPASLKGLPWHGKAPRPTEAALIWTLV